MKKSIIHSFPLRTATTLLITVFTCVASWAQSYVFVYSNPQSGADVQVGTSLVLDEFVQGAGFTMAEPGQTIYFGYSIKSGYEFKGIRCEDLASDAFTQVTDKIFSFTMPDNAQFLEIFVELEEIPLEVTGVEINEDNFPDPNFRAWLHTQSYGTDDVITDQEMAGIKKIEARSAGITNLTGIEHFTALRELIVGNFDETPEEEWNRISSIDLSGTPLLSTLCINNNQLSGTLDLSGITDLRNLDCSGNALTQLNLESNPELAYLECNGNLLTSIDVTNNPSLVLLHCSANHLSELNLANNPLLEQLFCDNNQLTELDLSKQEMLRLLNCYTNQLTALEVNSDQLYQLYCYNNQIKGQAMDGLISSLPDAGGYLVGFDLDSETEQNEMTDEQVAAAKAKGWSVEAWLVEDFVPYPYDENAHEYVDLGLSSGTLWAECNIGAVRPYRTGLFFAWGDTEGHGSDLSDGYEFNWENYKWGEVIGEETFFTKYCSDSSRGKDGFTDGKYGLALEDDAAYVNWGPEWRMPTKEQFDELLSECTWTPMFWEVDGYEVVGPNGNSIFLPVTGWRLDDMLLEGGAYWSRTTDPENLGGAYQLAWDDYGWYSFGGRCNGQCVRPVVSTHKVVELTNDTDNSETIETAAADGDTYDVTLADRTLYKDGSWNTLCLPFDVNISGSVLDGDNVQLMTLDDADFNDGTLTLNFTPATTIEAGKPYIIKWDETGDDLVNPVFGGVTVGSSETTPVEITGVISFTGTYAPVSIEAEGDRTKLFMGASNTLYYPNAAMTIGCQRAYFQLAEGLTAGDINTSVNAIVLNFNGETTAIDALQWSMVNDQWSMENGQWYSLDGRKLQGQPTQRGIYIKDGKKYHIH